MITRLKLVLEQEEYSALMKYALADLRNPSDQVRFVLRTELERRGLLQAQPAQPAQQPAPVKGREQLTP